MKVKCHCGAVYQVPPQFHGKQVRCKKCSGSFLVPSGSSSVATAPAQAANRMRATAASTRAAARPAPRKKTAAQLKREKEDALLAKYSGNRKKSAEDIIAESFENSFDEANHRAAVISIAIGIILIAVSIFLFYYLNSIEDGDVVLRIVWVFLMIGGKWWLPPAIFLFGLFRLVVGIRDVSSVARVRKQRKKSRA